MHTFTDGPITVVISRTDTDPPVSLFARIRAGIKGSWDWWYGEVDDGWWATVIVGEDADGIVGNPDWQELPELFVVDIMARLRGAVPA